MELSEKDFSFFLNLASMYIITKFRYMERKYEKLACSLQLDYLIE